MSDWFLALRLSMTSDFRMTITIHFLAARAVAAEVDN